MESKDKKNHLIVECPDTKQMVDVSEFVRLISTDSPLFYDRELDKALNFFMRNLNQSKLCNEKEDMLNDSIVIVQEIRTLFKKTTVLNK